MPGTPADIRADAAATPVRIFVGAHAHESLPLAVLAYSIRRRTALPVVLRTIDNSLVAAPTDARFAAYTRFSFARFAIPKLAGFQGRAIYLDSDMLVLADIAELWNAPFGDAKILVERFTARSRRKGRFTAVMLMNCAALPWDPDAIVARLGRDYDYEALMSIAPLLADGELQDRLPLGWNSLDRRTWRTRLVHYTKVPTQPWVYPGHRCGHLWVNEVRHMLAEGALDADVLATEVARGHVRPSLLTELGLDGSGGSRRLGRRRRHLLDVDRRAGFVPHRELMETRARRDAARAAASPDASRPGWRPLRRLLGRR